MITVRNTVSRADRVREEVAGLSGYHDQLTEWYGNLEATLRSGGLTCLFGMSIVHCPLDCGRSLYLDICPIGEEDRPLESRVYAYVYRMPVSLRWEVTCYLT